VTEDTAARLGPMWCLGNGLFRPCVAQPGRHRPGCGRHPLL